MKKNNDQNIVELLQDEIDKMIHEPARLKILIYLYIVDSADFVYLMHKTGLTKGNLSSHLSKLESAGYVVVNKEFVDKIPRTLVSLSDNGRKAFESYKDQILSLFNLI